MHDVTELKFDGQLKLLLPLHGLNNFYFDENGASICISINAPTVTFDYIEIWNKVVVDGDFYWSRSLVSTIWAEIWRG